MNIDKPVRKSLHKPLAQDLHIARHHNEFNVSGLDLSDLGSLLLRLVVSRDSETFEWDFECLGLFWATYS